MVRRPMFAALVTLTALLGATGPLTGQARGQVEAAIQAYEALDYPRAAELADRALQDGGDLAVEDRAVAYEVLGYSLGIMNEPDRAVQALSQMILIEPEREPDPTNLPPRLIDLWNQALGQVLVVRGLLVDSTSFVSGEGEVTLHWEVSRPAETEVRVVGPGVDAVVHTRLANPGDVRWDWNAFIGEAPAPAGSYQLVVTATEGPNQYQRAVPFTIDHAPVDTVPLLTSLPGFSKLPESEIPPRDWRPLGMSTLLTGAVGGAALALNNSAFDGARLELGLGALVSLGAGLILSLRDPPPRPVPAAIRYNSLVDRTLADRNAEIALQNVDRRRRVLLSIREVQR